MFGTSRLRKLKVAALCGADWARAMNQAVGVKPMRSPPLTINSPLLSDFLGKASRSDVLALNLHGFYGQENLYGQKGGQVGPMALTPFDVAEHDWDGVTVFMEVCYSASNAPGNRKLADAFLKNGARAVIGSKTEAYGRVRPTLPIPGSDGEADRLLQFFLLWMKRGVAPNKALRKAKRGLKFWSFPLDREDRATLKSFVVLDKL